ncbi:MAG: AEC family transporter [Mogibacterium sp.]|nr:AEC family transporter [Mogibacterium sp.]MBQ6440957.1 AEC family transporter [Mogibacterium sp.]
MLLIFSKVLVVFIYIGVGFIANRLKVLTEESVKHFISLIMGITVPCLMLSSITSQDINGSMYRNTILVLVLSALVYIVTTAVTTFVSDRIFPWKDQQDRNVLASGMTGCNSGFMGLPIASAVFGELVFYYLAIQTIVNNTYLFVVSLSQLHHRESQKSAKSLSEKLRPLVNPTSVATVVAVIMLFAGMHLPEYIMGIVEPLGDVTIPLSMILVGVRLGGTDFKRLLSDKALIITSAVKLVVMPVMALLILTPFPVDPVVKLTTLLAVCFPSAVIGVAVAAQEKKNSQLMAEVVAVSTLLSIITLPVWIMIISRLYL